MRSKDLVSRELVSHRGLHANGKAGLCRIYATKDIAYEILTDFIHVPVGPVD